MYKYYLETLVNNNSYIMIYRDDGTSLKVSGYISITDETRLLSAIKGDRVAIKYFINLAEQIGFFSRTGYCNFEDLQRSRARVGGRAYILGLYSYSIPKYIN